MSASARFSFSRRAVLAAALAVPCARIAMSAVPTRPATLDWAILETLLALGHPPVAATELILFREIAVEPPVPAGVADLGLRGLPNLETLLFARPDIIFNSNFYAALEPRLASIAPVESFDLYRPGVPPWEPMVAMTQAVATHLGDAGAGAALVTETGAEFVRLRERLGTVERPVLPINLGDARHFRAFGFDSMIGEAVTRLGLLNGWDAATSYSAAAPVGIEALAQHAEAWIVLIGPTPPDAEEALRRSAFWRALPAVAAGRVLRLGPVDPFGALPSARRLARLLTQALIEARDKARG